MNKLSFVAIFILSICIQQAAYAESYCERRKLGWHFYCNKNDEEKEAIKAPITVEEAKEAKQTFIQKLEDALTLALMNPTKENGINYFKIHKEVFNKSTKFANMMQKITWQHPELDYTLKRPISIVGNEVLTQIKLEEKQRILGSLKNRYGLFFFYRSNCVYCHRFSPILKRYSEVNGIEVMPISMDGGHLPEWNKFITNAGEAGRFGMEDKPVPALIMFDSKTQKVITVGFGLMTMDALTERIITLVKYNEGITE